jgi:hypothetical protein
MEVVDIWPGKDVSVRIGHTPGAWDCPCSPWVKTDMDIAPSGLRTVRHVAFDDQD